MNLPGFLKWFDLLAVHFAHASLVIGGIIFSILFLQNPDSMSPSKRIKGMLVMGLFLLIAGYFLMPFYGISKIYATPTWALYSAAICCFIFPVIYGLVDLKGIVGWTKFLRPAGANPLLAYILPYIVYAIFGVSYLTEAFNRGSLGILRSIVFTLIILGVTDFLTKKKVRLQL